MLRIQSPPYSCDSNNFPSSSPPMLPKDSWLDDDMVLLDVEGELIDASDIESSNDDFFHI